MRKFAIPAQTCAAAAFPTGLAGPCGATFNPAASARLAIFFSSSMPPQYFTSGITMSTDPASMYRRNPCVP
jgi:hypothetical protein